MTAVLRGCHYNDQGSSPKSTKSRNHFHITPEKQVLHNKHPAATKLAALHKCKEQTVGSKVRTINFCLLGWFS